MFDEVLKMVKDHLGNNQEISSLPADQQDAVHHACRPQVFSTMKLLLNIPCRFVQ